MPDFRFAKRAVNNQELLNHISLTTVNALNAWRTRRNDTEKAFSYAEHGSWEYNSDLKDELTDKNIPTLKINIIFPRLQRILGYEQELRGRIVASSMKKEGDIDADIATKLLDWTNQVGDNSRDEEISEAFKWAVVGEMGGFIEIRWDTEQDILGVPVIEHVPSLYILPDPAFPLYHVRKHRFIIKTFWMSLDQVLAQFPGKTDEIKMILGNFTETYDWRRILQDWWQSIRGAGEELRHEFVDTKEDMIRVIEMQERRKIQETNIIDSATGEVIDGVTEKVADMSSRIMAGNALGENDKLSNEEFLGLQMMMQRQAPWAKIRRTRDEVWTHTSLADYVLLQSMPNEVQNGMFSIIPLAGYDYGGKNFGLVKQLFGVQEEVELARSAELHILHTTAASGYIYEKQMLDQEMKERLESKGASAGLIIELEPGGMGRFQKIQPNTPPSGEIARSDRALRDADIISSIGEGELGRAEPGKESGILHRQRVQQSMITLKTLFANLDRTKKMLGRYLLDLMQAKLQPGRVIAIIGKDNQVEEVTVGDSLKFGKWDIKVAIGTNTDTQRLQRLLEIDSLLQRMPTELIPFHLVIDLLDWPEKEEWKQYIMQRLGISTNDQQQLAAALRNAGQNGGMDLSALLGGAGGQGMPQPIAGGEMPTNENAMAGMI